MISYNISVISLGFHAISCDIYVIVLDVIKISIGFLV